MRSSSIFLVALMLGMQTVASASMDLPNEPRLLRKKDKKQTRNQPSITQGTVEVTESQQSSVNVTQTKPCLLYLEVRDKLGEDQFKWRCKMSGQDGINAGAIGGLHAYVDIQGMDYVLAADSITVSGKTHLFAVGAVVEDHLLVITENNEVTLDNDWRDETVGNYTTPTGNKDALVVRVITTDAQPAATAAEMSDAFFGINDNTVSLKSQYEACPNYQITITPAAGTGTACADNANYTGFFQYCAGFGDCDYFTFFHSVGQDACFEWGDSVDLGGGTETGNSSCCACGGGTTTNYNLNVVDGVLEINVPVAASSLTSNQLEEAALNELETQFSTTHLEDLFDLVMLCLPPGTTDGAWEAYAGLSGYVSVYNDNACLSPSVQVHEVGHNIGLVPCDVP